MAACQTNRYRCLALLVSSYGFWANHGTVGVVGGYDGDERGLSDTPHSRPSKLLN